MPDQNLIHKLDIVIENLTEIIYDILKLDGEHDHPILIAYQKIKIYRETMLLESQSRFNSPDLQSLPPNWWIDSDKEIVIWYDQERQGVPENQRIALNVEQQEIVRLNKWFDAEVEKLGEENKDKPHKDYFGPGIVVLSSIFLSLNPDFASSTKK